MLTRLVKILTSLRLTVVLLAFAITIVFCGTIAQVNEGLYDAQARWFRSFFIWWTARDGGFKIPFLPGGYLVGTLLLVNLVAAHLARFSLTWKKLGINLAHFGIILLLAGQLATDLLSHESVMSFAEGETRNYSVKQGKAELVFVSDAGDHENVIAIPQSLLAQRGEITLPKLPFTIHVRDFYVNSAVRRRAPMMDKGEPPASQGVGPKVTLIPQAATKKMDDVNEPAAVLELYTPQGSLGTWLVQPNLDEQLLELDKLNWRIALRFERIYHPFSVQLLKTTHEVYRGTDVPKNFQSRVRIENPVTHESREVDIFMNNPLRYGGLTFFQFQMGRDQMDESRGTSALQVVRNPSWLTPYVGCALVGGGLVIQFLMHLVGFIKKRRTT
ncbi:MAG: hypothetical protein RLZZ350_491 [Verrucomicrobiota bacterium]|jgi:hypothetical protein